MPKKAGKKGSKKGGKKGGGKKKSGSKKHKRSLDPELAAALNNANVWAARVDISKKSRNDYRNACKNLAVMNQKLTNDMQGTEKHSIDLMSQLKSDDLRKNAEIVKLEQKLRDFDTNAKSEKKKIHETYTDEINQLSIENNEKDQEIQILQNELQKVKEFRQNKQKMREEINIFKNYLDKTTENHEVTVHDMESKFQAEKVKLEKEAANKISELAERAHKDAVTNLDEVTRQVYQDNVRLTDALKKHNFENEGLKSENKKLTETTFSLSESILENDKKVKSKILEAKSLKENRIDLKNAIKSLEHQFEENLSITEYETTQAISSHENRNIELQQQIHSLSRMLQLQAHEMRKLRRSANNVLNERSDIEKYLVNALNLVKENQNEEKKEFDIGKMQWSDREIILRLLFQQMNFTTAKRLGKEQKEVLPEIGSK